MRRLREFVSQLAVIEDPAARVRAIGRGGRSGRGDGLRDDHNGDPLVFNTYGEMKSFFDAELERNYIEHFGKKP